MFSSLFLTSIALVFVTGISAQWEVVVKLPKGDVQGSLQSSSKGQYAAFRGIPYAKPPIESLRLQDPVEPDAWSGIHDATRFGSKCPQWDSRKENTVGDENCLFINVYTPLTFQQGMNPSSFSFPVMVFIHGGKFQRGSADAYDPAWFMEDEIVLVTFNYRLGILGFLSTGDGTLPGNLGLKDQVLALQWVRDNIDKFGGNTSSITLFGQGSGAASAFLHILSPKSQGLFHNAITQSGSPICDWTIEENPRSYAVEIAQKLGCSTKSNSAMVNCIRSKPQKDILAAQKDEKSFGDYPLRAIPVVDNKEGFLPETPIKILSSGNFKLIPLISGINKDDGAIFYPLIYSYQDSLKKDSTFLLTRLIPMFVTTATDIRGNIESVSEALYFHYFNDVDPTNVTQVLQPFINMTTDAMFVSCNYKTLQNYSARGARTHMYVLQYRGDHSMLESEVGRQLDYKGVSHGDELLYLFTNKDFGKISDNRKKSQFHFMWKTFARTGEVHNQATANIAEYPKWEPYTPEFNNYYLIDESIQLMTSYKQRDINLWLKHLPALSKIRSLDDGRAETKVGGFGWAMLVIALLLLIVVAVLAVKLLRRSKYFSTKTEEN